MDNFKKIKRKFTIEALLIALFAALFTGVAVSSILVLTYKQLGLEYNLLLFILIGVAVFVVCGVILFFILKPNNIKVAKRIDKQLHLKEKVHTMIEYEGKEGYLVSLQREDAKQKLNEISAKKVKFKFHYFWLIFPLVALPLCLSSILVKGVETTPPPIEEKPISGDPKIIQQIRDLIREVNEDVNLIPAVKEAYVGHLEDLITAIDVPNITRSDEVEAVNLTINNISYSRINLNSIDNIADALSNSNQEEAHLLGVALDTFLEDEINNALDDIGSYIITPSSPTQRKQNFEELVTNGFNLIDMERLPEDDELYQVFINLKADLETALNSENNTSAVNTVVKDAKADLNYAVLRQKESLDMASYIETRLTVIFQLPDPEEPVNPDIPDGPIDVEDPTKPGGGGGGHGDTIYPGNDPVYDPDEGLVPYYEVINKYSAYIEGLVQDGVISEELANYYIEYFNNLYQANEDSE